MSEIITISTDEIIHQVKLSRQIPTIVEGILARKAIARAAKEMGISAETEELQKAADAIRLMSDLFSSEATWAWLEKHHLSIDEFEELVSTNVISAKLAQHMFAEQVEPFFVNHQLDYAQAVVYEVILSDEDQAMGLFYEIQEGALNFHTVAHERIQDISLRRAGGYLGLKRRSDLKPVFSAAVFAATPPQVLKPIITSQGAHLILVEEIIQAELNDTLRQTILADLFNTWLKQEVAETEVVTDSASGKTVFSAA
jgi:parvulin-like peptidyl-prolyl isomerase